MDMDNEQTNKLWTQINQELITHSITRVDTSSGNLYLFVTTAKNKWIIICGGLVKIASIPEIKDEDEHALRPEYLVNHSINYLRPTYEEVQYWDVDTENKFMSIDNVTIELLGPNFSFLLQIDKLGLSME
jgi:hypothetical protein